MFFFKKKYLSQRGKKKENETRKRNEIYFVGTLIILCFGEALKFSPLEPLWF